MADVKIFDIDGEQWNIKDQDTRDRIAILEDSLSTKDLPDAQIIMVDGYTCSSIKITECYKVGKIIFSYLRIENLSGKGVGGTSDITIADTNFIPKKYTSFIARDYIAPATVKCYLKDNGELCLGESNGVKDGYNVICGELIFAEG